MLTSLEAIRQARLSLRLADAAAGNAWAVRRLDGEPPYFLVHVAGHVACVDMRGGEVLASAPSPHSPVALEHARAQALAGMPDASAELVWKACAATRSMFDPLWEVRQHGQVVYVDQRGQCWLALAAPRPGAGRG